MVKTFELPINVTSTEEGDLFNDLGLEIDDDEQLGLRLSAYINNLWEDAKRVKQPIEALMLAMKRQKEGEYDADVLAAIKSIEMPEDFIKLTGAKCRAAKAWIKEIILSPTQRIWGIEPTPVPELPDYIKQTLEKELFDQAVNQFIAVAQQTGQPIPAEAILAQIKQMMPEFTKYAHNELSKKARDLADQMADKIDDQLTEGGFYEALNKSIDDIVDYKAGFIKGPVFRKEKVKKIDRNPMTGQLFQHIEENIIPQYDRVSPFNIYPSSFSTNIEDGYLFEVIRLNPQDLYRLIGIKGYNENSIRAVLEEFQDNGINKWLNLPIEVEEATGDDDLDSPSRSERIPVLEFWGQISGDMLLEWGMTKKQIKDPDNFYDVCLWFVGSHILKCILNPDGVGEKPYSKTSYISEQDSFWGDGLPDTIKDIQRICNSTVRAIVVNMAFGSGPQVERNIDRIPPGESKKMWPLKTWDVTDEQMSTAPALKFYQPQMVIQQLIAVYQHFSRLADEHSGVPAYAHGDTQVGGAGSALANYEKVLTPNGPTEIALLKIGDLVVNSYGSFSKVTGVFPQGETDIFRLKFSNGEHSDCDENHRWSVRTHHDRKFRTLTTGEINSKGLFRKTQIGRRNPNGFRPKWMLPLIDFVEFEEKSIKIDAYTMGVLIGNGDARCRITAMDKEIFDKIPYPLGKEDHSNESKAWACTVKGIKKYYHSYGLKCKTTEKFIPKEYLFNSQKVRLELLRGLMDTDGCCTKESETFYSTSSLKLALDFTKLIRSLGGITKEMRFEEGGDFEIRGRKATRKKNYRITFNLSNKKLFHVERKKERTREKQKLHTYITGIEYMGRSEATCISVDSADSLFICENFIPTHNTASGLSMLVAMAARGIRAVIGNIDRDFIIPILQRQYEYNINQKEMFSMIGDYKIVAKGSSALMRKEQQAVRKTEMLTATNNPVDMQIIGAEGRKAQLIDAFQSLDIATDRIIPEKMPINPLPLLQQLGMQPQQGLIGQGQPLEQGSPQTGTMAASPSPGPSALAPTPPLPKPANLDQAGNNVQGVGTRMFNG